MLLPQELEEQAVLVFKSLLLVLLLIQRVLVH